MREIDRAVIGSERRGWHPVNPFHVKRHGEPKIISPNRCRQRSLLSGSRKWLTKRFAQARSPSFWLTLASITGNEEKTRACARAYGPVLLTMIKNGLTRPFLSRRLTHRMFRDGGEQPIDGRAFVTSAGNNAGSSFARGISRPALRHLSKVNEGSD